MHPGFASELILGTLEGKAMWVGRSFCSLIWGLGVEGVQGLSCRFRHLCV